MPANAPPLSINAWMRWDVIRPRVEALRPNRIIEAGVGGGSMGARLRQLTTEYWGVEPDETSRLLAAERLPGIVLAATVEELPPGEADLVCAFEVLEHLDDDRAVLREWLTRLAPGGRFIASVPSDPDRFGPWDELAGHQRRYSDDGLRQLMADVGLTTEAVEPYGFPISWVLESVRNATARRRGIPAGDEAEQTSKSARVLQPRPWMGTATTVVSAPCRLVQRQFGHHGPRTGVVVVARRP
jgi:SAM-dependent methyltransferase